MPLYFSGNSPWENTSTGPARFTSPCSITIFTPGCSMSLVLKMVWHSWALSMVYFSFTIITPISSPLSSSTSAISLPTAMLSAVALSTDLVMGIGQNRPLARVILSHTDCQSALPMKPSSGVKPPMPSMIRSPVSREDSFTWSNLAAAAWALARASPSSRSVFNTSLPWGFTSFDMALLVPVDGENGVAATQGFCAKGAALYPVRRLRSGRIVDIHKLVIQLEFFRQIPAHGPGTAPFGGMVARRQVVNAALPRHVHGLFRDLAADVGIRSQRHCLLDIALGATGAPGHQIGR